MGKFFGTLGGLILVLAAILAGLVYLWCAAWCGPLLDHCIC